MSEVKPREKLAKKMAARVEAERKSDPHDLHGKSVRELIDWMGAGNAVPGSITYNHAELVLRNKERAEAEATERLPRDTDRPGVELAAPEPVQAEDRLSEGNIAVLVLAATVFLAVLASTRSVVWGLVGAVITLAALQVPPIRRALVALLPRV